MPKKTPPADTDGKSLFPRAPVNEIFFSYQGEGERLGEPQIFIRLAGCNLKCSYCDTPQALKKKNGKLMSVSEVVGKVELLRRKNRFIPSVVSITGGEPLIHAEFLRQLIPYLKKMSLKVMLETNGSVFPSETVKKILRQVHFVSADIKLPSSAIKTTATACAIFKKHSVFLKEVPPEKLCLKIPITSATNEKEFCRAAALVKKYTPQSVPVFIQPVSPSRKRAEGGSPSYHATDASSCNQLPSPQKVFILGSLAKKILGHRRKIHIMPQMHKLYWKIK